MDSALYLRLAADLIDDIRAGEIAPGQPVPSMRTLARWGYVGKCSGHYYHPMAIATAQRARRLVDRSGMVAVNPPHSGRSSRVLPRGEWNEPVPIS